MTQHRNSLGYRIGHDGEAMIVEGYDDSGNIVRIGDAERGSSQGLKCACKADLVAKQGDELAWHFAHASGQTGFCAEATRATAMRFIREVLVDARAISLPEAKGIVRVESIHSIDGEGYGEFPIHRISGEPFASLAIVTKLKRKSAEFLIERARRKNIPVVEIALHKFRNRSDAEIAEALIDDAPRKWLYFSYLSMPEHNYEIYFSSLDEIRKGLGFIR